VKDNKIVVAGDFPREGERIKAAFAVARDLAEKVAAGAKAG
jgi:transcription-repair coupling factor (superfamily II helicase)